MKISIIIACPKGESAVRATIESALAEDWHDKEIIVVDEGPSEILDPILSSFGDRIRRERVHKKGVAHAWNHGLQRSSGGLLKFLTENETLTRGKLSHQAQAAIDGAWDVVYSDWRYVHRAGGGCWNIEPVTITRRPPDLIYGFLTGWNPRPLVCLFRRSFLTLFGGWDETLFGSPGRELFCRIILVATDKLLYLPGCTGVLRLDHEQEEALALRAAAFRDEFGFLTKMEGVLKAEVRWDFYAKAGARSYRRLAREFEMIDPPLYKELIWRAENIEAGLPG